VSIVNNTTGKHPQSVLKFFYFDLKNNKIDLQNNFQVTSFTRKQLILVLNTKLTQLSYILSLA